MTKGKHDLLLRIVKTLGAIMITVPFALCWYLYYGKDVVSPFYAKGNFMMIALFFVLFIVFGRVYGAFLMSMQRSSEIVYAQFLAAGATDLIMYIVICLLSKGFPNLLPGVAALVGQVVLAGVWAVSAHRWYFNTFPPQETAIIYDMRRGMDALINQYGLDKKYHVTLTASAEECIQNLSMLDSMETVFFSGIHSHDRNIILKYGVARLSTGDKDDRITPVGKVIRACRVDELPQLINILKGELSIVGPRPERPEIAAQYCKEMPEFALRLQAKAGLTGYAQVYGKYNSTPYDKLMMDLMYIAHPGIAEDFKIMLATVKILFLPESTEGVAEGSTTAMGQGEAEAAASKAKKEEK